MFRLPWTDFWSIFGQILANICVGLAESLAYFQLIFDHFLVDLKPILGWILVHF